MNFHLPSLSLGAILAFIIAGAGLFGYAKLHPAQSVQAAPSAALSGVATEAIQPKTIIVYRDAAKKMVNLPKPIQEDKSQKVTASTNLNANPHSETVTSVLNTDTGLTQLYVRENPLPWLAREKQSNLYLGYGIKRNQLTWRLEGRENLVQIKAAHLGIIGSLDGDRDYFIGLGVGASW